MNFSYLVLNQINYLLGFKSFGDCIPNININTIHN